MTVTAEDVLETLRGCYDPEIPISIVDLGLVYDVRVDGPQVLVQMTLTTRACPMHARITGEVAEKVKAMDGVEEADVRLVWDPPWNPEMMSDEGKKELGRS